VSPFVVRFGLGLAGLATTAVAIAQAASTPPASSASKPQAGATSAQTAQAGPVRKEWIGLGQPGSIVDGKYLHAQVVLDASGFSPGVIDGQKGESFRLALRGFQHAKGLKPTGDLDKLTIRALLQANRPAIARVTLTPEDVQSRFVYPFPENPEQQAELQFLGYRNMLEKLAERYHTTPNTIIALNGPDKKIGVGQQLILPNVIPTSQDYAGAQGGGGQLMKVLNVNGEQPQGDYVVVDKSEGILKVYRGTPPGGAEGEAKAAKASAQPGGSAGTGQLVAAFPVTMGSSRYPLPIGRWKVTTYAYMPPFKYQPQLLNNAKTDKELDLPPGPNGPVGVAWLDLTKEHYGIHGTPEPQTIGRAESSGCIRMTNWDVLRLSRMMKPGFTAIFQA
jgi:lipoprotein-anchoring transpeptidase ErfK/SrfK